MVNPGVILVTGGAGFIGSHVVEEILERGFHVRVLDCLHPGAHRVAPDYLPGEADVMLEDLRDPEAVERALKGVHVVCHLGSMVGLGRGVADVRAYVDHNDAGTACLLAGMADAGFRGRLVLAGSMVVYGEGRYRCARHGIVRPAARSARRMSAGAFDPLCPGCEIPLEPEAIPEDAPLEPLSVYAATKLHQEHLCEVFARETGTSYAALRYHNVYGPRMPRDTPYAGVASIFRSALEAGESPEVYEDGAQIRDFIHVRDVARVTAIAAVERTDATGAFNVASGRPHAVGAMAEALSRAFGSGAPPPVVTGAFRMGDVRHVFASPARARDVLGFEASIPFEDGMVEFAAAPLRDGC